MRSRGTEAEPKVRDHEGHGTGGDTFLGTIRSVTKRHGTSRHDGWLAEAVILN